MDITGNIHSSMYSRSEMWDWGDLTWDVSKISL